MINVKELVVAKLKEVNSNVVETYPNDFTKLPIIVYTEEDNSPYIITNKERMSRIVYKIDIYHKTSCSDIAKDIDSKMSTLGFKRSFAGDINTAEYRHKVMRYEVIIDSITNRAFMPN